MEAVRTSETSVDNNFTRQYISENNSEQNILLLQKTIRQGNKWLHNYGFKNIHNASHGKAFSTEAYHKIQILRTQDIWQSIPVRDRVMILVITALKCTERPCC
jgi:hypothetical protein